MPKVDAAAIDKYEASAQFQDIVHSVQAEQPESAARSFSEQGRHNGACFKVCRAF